MRATSWGAWCFILAGSAAFGQAGEGKPEFEVASVKPAVLDPGGRIRVMMRGGPGSPDPGQVTYSGVSLKDLLTNAYGVKPFQITGPGWLDSERYDIAAKIPEGTTKEQFKLMLQNLLAERFHMTLHHETKDLPLYELVVAKNGPKMEPSAEDPSVDSKAPIAPPAPGKDGFPQLPAGRKGAFMMRMPGRMRIAASVQTTSALADMLGNQVGSPVVDKTGLTGTYDYTLEFAPEPGQGPFAGLPPPPPPAGDAGAPGGLAGGQLPGNSANQGDAPSLFTAIQEQLGLRLEKKKGPLDTLVIDRADKVPTEN